MSRHAIHIPLAAALVAALWTFACGDGGTEPPPPEPPRAMTVTVTPATTQLTALGATVQLSAQVLDQDGQTMAGAAVAWTSSVATVATVNEGGLVTAAGNGSTTIAATAGSVAGTATVTVSQEVNAVTVSPAANTLVVGDTVRLSPAADDANGHAVADAKFVWSTTDPQVAVVDESGLVSGVATGTATITATAEGARGTSEISVINPDPEWAVLASLYEATNGAGWIENDGWLSDRPIGEWHGVTTGEGGRVTALRLPASNLVGSIPPELGDLPSLEILDFERNVLAGRIPPELGELASLKTLILGVNRLTGQIPPELGDLTNLETLRLRRNSLMGPIPPKLGNLGNLTRLGLERNQLRGSIPSAFLGLEQLHSLHFADNEGLCVSGSTDFAVWLDRLEVYVGPLCNERDREGLVSLYEAAGGTDWTNSDGWLGDGTLGEWHGVDVDSLGQVTGLGLADNGLAGRVSGSVAQLTSLISLRLDDNAALAGALPLSLSALSLQELHYQGTELCTPPGRSFAEWLDAIASHEGTNTECSPLSDREVLALLYDETGGTDWTRSENWLSDRPLGEWHGVNTGVDDRVVSLSLFRNNLSGPIPSELGNLSALEELYLNSNNLTGPIPDELGSLSALEQLNLRSNNLTGPIPNQLGDLSSLLSLSLGFDDLTGPIPPELGNLSSLQELFLGYSDLTGPIPSELGNLPSLRELFLGYSDLTGPIPPELGNLSSLRELFLGYNGLTGPIPSELGNLSSLLSLSLSGNDLTGPIPPELGNLSSLEWLGLTGNTLTGPIPPELGGLSNLESLDLRRNTLTGPIPPELGGLSNLESLDLSRNTLTGPISPELGGLSRLGSLSLAENQLTGSLPPESGGMTGMTRLNLANNAKMSGPLPPSLTALAALDQLLLSGTGLCAPADAGFTDWLREVELARVRRCDTEEGSKAYLTQAVQSLPFPVPLVAGEPALLRVLVTATSATSEGIPPVRATFYVDDVETHTVDIAGSATPIPTELDDAESGLEQSANVEIPGSVLQPGLEMVIEIDPDNTLDPLLGVTKRIPRTGRTPVRVVTMPVLDLTFVPFLWAQGSDSSIVDVVEAMASDPQGHEMLWDTRTLLPVGALDVSAHAPVLTSTTSVFKLAGETALIRALENGTGYFMGTLSVSAVGGQSGVATIGGRVAFAVFDPFVIAHELGHSLSLRHAPCGTNGDPAFPHSDGSTGAWGYDFRGDGALISPRARDLMSYCGPPRWVSDFSFTKALNHRLRQESAAAASAEAPTSTILLWGGVDDQGQPYLEPAFVAEASPTLPRSPGEYRLTGRAAAGGELFSLSFDMPETADADGRSSFVFALPARTEWAGVLESITLSGPAGSVTIDQATDQPMAILRDPDSRQVRGILRGEWSIAMDRDGAAIGLPPGSNLEVILSRGIPDEVRWR